MTNGALGLGVIGLGFMGRRDARFVSQIDGIRLAGVCEIDAALAHEVAAEVGGSVDPVVAFLPVFRGLPPRLPLSRSRGR